MKKLTLSADPKVIEQARKLAKENGTSISSMFERFIRILVRRNQASDEIPKDSITAQATGLIRLPKGKSEREVLTDALMEKYGVKKN